jgi:hypothetical protein
MADISNLDVRPAPSVCGGREEVSARPVHELLEPREVPLGESTVVRRLRGLGRGRHFGTVEGYQGLALTAPALPDVPLKACGRTR